MPLSLKLFPALRKQSSASTRATDCAFGSESPKPLRTTDADFPARAEIFW